MRAKTNILEGVTPTAAITSISVARAARVSQSTVSLVLSGKAAGRVSATTKALVEETARRLGYQPNVSAQALRTGSAKILALAVPNVQQPFFGQIFVAAELKAREHDFVVILIDTTTDPLWAERLLGMVRSRLVAGCIVYASDARSGPTLASLGPSVLFVEADDSKMSGIDLDLATAMRDVVQHLAGLGHKRIGYFAADYPKATYQRRFASFVKELKRAGIAYRPEWRTSATFELEAATRRIMDLLRRADISALFCDDDLLAGAAYRAARRLGISIPGRLSVVGFNDIEFSRLLEPELTTVAIPAEIIATAAVERLILQLEGRTRTPRRLVAQLELRVRGSTSAPSV
jgi:DNA-binding LacI/PurR family transcriptional regulator